VSDPLPIVGVTGSRSLNGERDCKLVFDWLDKAWEKWGPFRLAHGDCPQGGDRWAKAWCEEKGVEQIVFQPETKATWAFHKRNREIVDASVRLIAFWDGTLTKGGTIYTMRYAASRGVPVHDVLAKGQSRERWQPEG
jgi:hypothetical protein